MDWPRLLEEELSRLHREDPGNRQESGGPYFHDPLLGFASADDPLFQRYKEIIGDFHLTPGEWFENAFGKGSWAGGTVVSWILPITGKTRRGNRDQKRLPTREWARTRNFGDKFNDRIRERFTAMLEAGGHRTVTPMLMDNWSSLEAPSVGWASNWSERHAAYAAGLGTFSLNNGLITQKGMAHRCGSLVTGLVLEPSPRPYNNHYDFCLHYRDRSCGVCIERCPSGSITREGQDKALCRHYLREVVLAEVGRPYGVEVAGCGLCQTGVPCEAKIPEGGRNEPDFRTEGVMDHGS
jgi:epoxyqueuosine reductase QueG